MEDPFKDSHFSELELSEEGFIIDSPDDGDEEVDQAFSSSKRPVDASPGTSPEKKKSKLLQKEPSSTDITYRLDKNGNIDPLPQSIQVARGADGYFHCLRCPKHYGHGKSLSRHAGDCKGTPNVESDGASLTYMEQLVYADNYPELAACPCLNGLVCLCCKVFVGVDQVYRHFRKPGTQTSQNQPLI
jgi:hypothetical protein